MEKEFIWGKHIKWKSPQLKFHPERFNVRNGVYLIFVKNWMFNFERRENTNNNEKKNPSNSFGIRYEQWEVFWDWLTDFKKWKTNWFSSSIYDGSHQHSSDPVVFDIAPTLFCFDKICLQFSFCFLFFIFCVLIELFKFFAIWNEMKNSMCLVFEENWQSPSFCIVIHFSSIFCFVSFQLLIMKQYAFSTQSSCDVFTSPRESIRFGFTTWIKRAQFWIQSHMFLVHKNLSFTFAFAKWMKPKFYKLKLCTEIFPRASNR